LNKFEIGKRLENVKRHFVSFILASLCVAASTYMVMESSGYYQKLYGLVGLSTSMGIFTAILSEAFQLVLVIALPSGQESRGTRFLLLTIVFFIYVFTVFASGINIAKPLVKQWSQSDQKEKLYGVLQEEQQTLRDELNLFKVQNQKVNSVLTIHASRENFQEIKNHLKKETPINTLLIQIELIVLWGLRILIQLANLCCGRLLAMTWMKNESFDKFNSQNRDVDQDKAKIIRRWKARYTRQEKGFIGVAELSDGTFLSITTEKKKRYKTFQGALNFFEGTPYRERINEEATWQLAN
jgi:hypothetical protein